MKAKRHVVVLAVLAVLIPALWAVVRAAEKTDGTAPQPKLAIEQRDTLRGLQGVAVAVEGLEPEVEQLGLTSEALQTDTELQLRQYGIRVLSHQEQLATPGMPYLYVNVNVKSIETVPIVAVNIQVKLQQHVSLERDPTILCSGTTWETGGVMMPLRSDLGQVRGGIKDIVAGFINDYLAVNPKKGKAKEGAAESKP